LDGLSGFFRFVFHLDGLTQALSWVQPGSPFETHAGDIMQIRHILGLAPEHKTV
jgi:hypothetical protein